MSNPADGLPGMLGKEMWRWGLCLHVPCISDRRIQVCFVLRAYAGNTIAVHSPIETLRSNAKQAVPEKTAKTWGWRLASVLIIYLMVSVIEISARRMKIASRMTMDSLVHTVGNIPRLHQYFSPQPRDRTMRSNASMFSDDSMLA